MARLQFLLSVFLTIFLVFACAELRTRRFAQFSEASASARSFGGHGRGFGPQFGPPGPHFGPPGPPGPHFGPPGPPIPFRPHFGPPRPPPFGPVFPGHGSGRSINIAKSISISTGGSGSASSQAGSQSGPFGK
ncbi:unnamed protein product [Danaus chrysippus]|uniref:(African queen) hypothetical protein n=1 Tax=Danaus chrysippus TaxID=151541 RepID=A0A8J2VVU7_9NEOP|nr:unnamed protein product [Danaus chrysippus]